MSQKQTKYIFVTGGVVSSLGKGITAASLAQLLIARGLKVTLQKFDPYINIDPGTMSPYQHGEVFVTEDGAETDLDLGHYERFTNVNLSKYSNMTSGKVYWNVLNKERKGEYLGGTVQVIPHITNEIKESLRQAEQANPELDVVITEIGGTVGDIESLPFLEAIRQMVYDLGRENVLYIHVTLVPYLGKAGELKTKPTQHSVKELRSLGIEPSIIVCRTEKPLSKEIKDKIGLFCNLSGREVIQNVDAESLYDLPMMLEEEGLAKLTIEKLGIQCGQPDLAEWQAMLNQSKSVEKCTKIALVGKYVELQDAYISVAESLKHAGIYHQCGVEIDWIQSEDLTSDNVAERLAGAQGILVPGGFGDRGVEGKILAIEYARKHKVPFLGICLGMQLAVVEFARNVLGLSKAHSSELMADTPHPVIDLMEAQKEIQDLGGTMRLGAYPCEIQAGTKAHAAYGTLHIQERHRHRYEVNTNYMEALRQGGLTLSGLSPNGQLVEIIEIEDHPWFVAAQFHPEFKSRPVKPHPLFKDFVAAAKAHS